MKHSKDKQIKELKKEIRKLRKALNEIRGQKMIDWLTGATKDIKEVENESV